MELLDKLKRLDYIESIIPNGKPKHIRAYLLEHLGTRKEYTIVYTNKKVTSNGRKWRPYIVAINDLLLNGRRLHTTYIDRPKHRHLGKRIGWDDIPGRTQRAAMEWYKEIWDIKEIPKVDREVYDSIFQKGRSVSVEDQEILMGWDRCVKRHIELEVSHG